MNKLTYQTLKEMQHTDFLLPSAPERMLQFGEGNFLRAFVDDFVDQLNEKADFCSKIVVCQPGSSDPAAADRINAQEGLYTLLLRGQEKGQAVQKKRIISCVSRCLNLYRDYEAWLECARNPELRFITSNTTEAGIVYDPSCQFTDQPPASFPAKLTQFLYRRFELFGSVPGKGFILLPCELIDENGTELKRCVLAYARQWQLGTSFEAWIEKENLFCSTLVDRIVTGYPQKEADTLCKAFGYEDNLIDTGETFAAWVIEGPQWLKQELPFEKAGLPVLICADHKPYKQRKVRILNGAHTAMVPGAYLAGQEIVRDCVQDPIIGRFMEKAIYEEIIPTLTLPKEDLTDFAAAVKERFANPFIDHALLSICLNCTSKWKTRVLPSLKAYLIQNGQLPPCLTASFAFYVAFYHQKAHLLKDDASVLAFYEERKLTSAQKLVSDVCRNQDFWGEDLSQLPEFEQTVTRLLEKIETEGTYAVMKACL